MKTVRFTQVVKRCGAPETHLILTKPAQDKALQAAIKAHRVMTVFQESVGTKTDSGKVGFEEGGGRQYLVFPKSLRAFEGRKVVGIKYDLLSSEEVPKSKRPRPAKAPKKPARKPRRKSSSTREPSSPKVVPFRTPEQDDHDEDDDLREVKRLARQAMHALEQGKQVAAFNLLKRIAAS